ncbi:hypothetical protein H0H87_003333 [Tephrocybe sp. NHM501043]|nr:hypothetical protein H0H87_003333 [Tephrocybe sp. NHM501043]
MLLQRAFSLSNFTYGLTYGRVAGLSMILCGLLGVRYLRRHFKGLRGAIEQGYSELSTVRLELARLEEALAAQVKEVDEGRRRLKESEEKLKEAMEDNKALNVQLGDRDREFKRQEDELQQHVSDHALTVQLLETRTQELKGNEAFLTKADLLSGADVVALINTINTEIYQTAANVAEAFEFKPKVSGMSREEVDGWGEIHASAMDMVGPQMVEILSSSEHSEDPTIVQIALQAAMAAYTNWIVRAWNLEDPEDDIGINTVYKGIRDSEEQAVSGRWRALTRKHLPKTPDHELSLLFVDAFVNILLVADASRTHGELQKAIETRFVEHVSIIVQGAQRLRKAIGEEITFCDFEIIFVNHDTPFSPALMDDAFAAAFEKGREDQELVLCTTELGLEKFEKRADKGGWDDTVIMRPKIALKSGIDEMMASSGNKP